MAHTMNYGDPGLPPPPIQQTKMNHIFNDLSQVTDRLRDTLARIEAHAKVLDGYVWDGGIPETAVDSGGGVLCEFTRLTSDLYDIANRLKEVTDFLNERV